ncbi:MAG TPA: hypothetical protein VFA63_14195 [Pseudonocardiaceae bacterium]|nr:hypothetical protein [Pseudonocardiaceae bacterium]
MSNVVGVRFNGVVSRHQVRQVDEVLGLGRLAGTRMGHHDFNSACAGTVRFRGEQPPRRGARLARRCSS